VPDAPAPHAVPVVQQLVQRLQRDRRRVVGLSLRLLDDDLELFGQLLRIDDRMGVGVGLDLEAGREARRGQHRVVARVVVDRVRVQVAAGGLGGLRDLADPSLLRALEEHVLEYMRDAHHIVGLVEVARLDVGDDGDDRRGVVTPDDDRQPVGQHGAADGRRIKQRAGRDRGEGRHGEGC
jgi:hypothetical protein